MLSLFNIKRIIITILAFGMYLLPNSVCALEDVSEKEIMENEINNNKQTHKKFAEYLEQLE